MTLNCVFKCVCKPGFLRVTDDGCIAEESTECGGKYDAMEALKKHKYDGILPADQHNN